MIFNIYIQSSSLRWKSRAWRNTSGSSWTRTRGQIQLTSHESPLNPDLQVDQEEAGIRAPLEHAGSLLFVSDGMKWAFQIEIYRANSYEGTVTE